MSCKKVPSSPLVCKHVHTNVCGVLTVYQTLCKTQWTRKTWPVSSWSLYIPTQYPKWNSWASPLPPKKNNLFLCWCSLSEWHHPVVQVQNTEEAFLPTSLSPIGSHHQISKCWPSKYVPNLSVCTASTLFQAAILSHLDNCNSSRLV